MDRWGRKRNELIRIEARKRLIALVKSDQIKESELDTNVKARETEARLNFLANFHCHITGCLEVSHEPAVHIIEDPENGESFEYTDWHDPGDLHRCLFCGKLTCEYHMHDGTCQECMKKF